MKLIIIELGCSGVRVGHGFRADNKVGGKKGGVEK
jgi:hypothetical protein